MTSPTTLGAPPISTTSTSNSDASLGVPETLQCTNGPPPVGTEISQPPSARLGPRAFSPFLTILSFSQNASRLLVARYAAAPGASCICVSSSAVALADASNSAEALKWNSFNVFPHPADGLRLVLSRLVLNRLVLNSFGDATQAQQIALRPE